MESKKLTCPECGENHFATNAALQSHRHFKHGVNSPNAKQPLSEKVMEKLEEMTNRIDEIQGNLKDKQEVTMATDEEMDRMCKLFPGLCKRVDRMSDIMESHPKPTPGLLKLWEQCPSCYPELQEMANAGMFDKFKSKAKVPAGESEEEEPDLPWVNREEE